jgi:hypothetical protein
LGTASLGGIIGSRDFIPDSLTTEGWTLALARGAVWTIASSPDAVAPPAPDTRHPTPGATAGSGPASLAPLSHRARGRRPSSDGPGLSTEAGGWPTRVSPLQDPKSNHRYSPSCSQRRGIASPPSAGLLRAPRSCFLPLQSSYLSQEDSSTIQRHCNFPFAPDWGILKAMGRDGQPTG